MPLPPPSSPVPVALTMMPGCPGPVCPRTLALPGGKAGIWGGPAGPVALLSLQTVGPLRRAARGTLSLPSPCLAGKQWGPLSGVFLNVQHSEREHKFLTRSSSAGRRKRRRRRGKHGPDRGRCGKPLPVSPGGEGVQWGLPGDRGVTCTLPLGKYEPPGYGQGTPGREAAPLGVPQSSGVPHRLAPPEAWPDPICTLTLHPDPASGTPIPPGQCNRLLRRQRQAPDEPESHPPCDSGDNRHWRYLNISKLAGGGGERRGYF